MYRAVWKSYPNKGINSRTFPCLHFGSEWQLHYWCHHIPGISTPRVGRETSLYKLFTCRPKGFSFSAILVSKWAYVNFRSCSLLELQIIVSRSSDNLQLKYLLTICCGLLLLPGILISRHQLFKRWIVLSDGEISIQGIGQLVFVWQSGTYPVELTRQRLNMFNMPNVWQIPEVEALIQAF